MRDGTCILDRLAPNDIIVDMNDENSWHGLKSTKTVHVGADGFYSFIFARCTPEENTVSFHLHADFHNPGPEYLSAGDVPLPAVYGLFFILFFASFITWCRVLCRPTHIGAVHGIHYLMAVLLFIKCVCLLVESIRLHFIAITGSDEGWSIVYFLITTLRGIMLFTVIMLIGFGWSLMKSHLNDREKKVILVVLSMQVFVNIAVVMLEECSPGSQWWLSWRDMLHLFDIMCCCAILFPIVWSIRHLRRAADVDGKAQINLHKLQLFRQFYVIVVAYIYFTRIVVLLLESTIPFYVLWIGPAFTELATLIFYVFTGYKFRPALDNPYIPLNFDERGLLTDHSEVEYVTSAELQSHVQINIRNL